MKVTFEECKRALVNPSESKAQRALREWRNRSGYEKVVDWVMDFEHDYLFQITIPNLRQVQKDSEHALGDVQSQEQMPEVEDFTCPFALEHLFHMYVERFKELPTWQRWWNWLWEEGAPGFIDPVKRYLGWSRAGRQQRRIFNRAIRWRLGKFYYSAFREVEFLTRMREEYGVYLSYHVLADVLLRADFWSGNVVLCTYFPNPRYRTGSGGRKPEAEKFLGDANPPFTIMNVEVERQGQGTFWTLSEDSLGRVASQIERTMESTGM